jgi:hypothetical protein
MVDGKGLLQICKDEDMPARGTVYRWLEAHKSFRDKYARAREAMMDYYVEQILAVAFDESGDIVIEGDRAVANHARVQRDRLKVDSLKWTASKLFPRQYGDKAGITADEPPSNMVVSWKKDDDDPITRIERIIIDPKAHGAHAEKPVSESRAITYAPAQPPADLTPEAWSAITRVSELIEQIAPGDETPEHVFGLIEGFLRSHFVAPLS